MIIFSVVKEEHGWAVRMGEGMTTPFWSRDSAIREANCLADAIRCHGEHAVVNVEGVDPNEMPERIESLSSSRLDVLWQNRPAGFF